MTLPSWTIPDFAQRLEAPLHIYCTDLLLADARALQQSLVSQLPQARLWFSVKTNPLLQLNQDLAKIGYGFEATTMGDQVALEKLKVPPQAILYNAFSRELWEFIYALDYLHCRFFQLDSPIQVDLLLDALRERPGRERDLEVALRIHSGHGHFGFARHSASLVENVKKLLAAGVKCTGLHIHRNTGGGAANAKEQKNIFVENFHMLLEQKKFLEKEIVHIDIRHFNLGGGMPSPHLYRLRHTDYSAYWEKGVLPKEAQDTPSSLEEMGSAIGAALSEELKKSDLEDMQIHFEPGRAICSRAFKTIARTIGCRKDLYPDARILLTAVHTQQLAPLKVESHPYSYHIHKPRETGPSYPTIVYGNLPYEYDILLPRAQLPELHHGDFLIFHHTGAYTIPFEGNFGYSQMPVYCSQSGKQLRQADRPYDYIKREIWAT